MLPASYYLNLITTIIRKHKLELDHHKVEDHFITHYYVNLGNQYDGILLYAHRNNLKELYILIAINNDRYCLKWHPPMRRFTKIRDVCFRESIVGMKALCKFLSEIADYEISDIDTKKLYGLK